MLNILITAPLTIKSEATDTSAIGNFIGSPNISIRSGSLSSEGLNKLIFPLTYRSNVPSDKLISLIIQEDIKNNLSDCISIDINGVESTTMYENLSKGVYPAAIYDWTGLYSDPEAYLKPLLSCNEIVENICKDGESVLSGSFWASKQIEDLFE